MKTKIQWHPNLNTKPLEIDLLVIMKDGSVHIANEIGYL